MKLRQDVVRRASAILLVLWIAGLVASFTARQMRRRPAVGGVAVQAAREPSGEPAVRVHKGFVYNDTIGIEPNFRIAARETVEFASGRYELNDVEVTLYNAGEVAYGMVADVARLDPARREAEATGQAQLSLGGGIAVRASGFLLRGADRTFESSRQVAFAGHGWGGVAGRAVGSLADNSVELVDGVLAVLRGPTATTVLLAPRASYFRQQARLDLPEGLTLLQNDLRAAAAHASLLLASAEGELRRLVLDEPVTVTGRLPDGSEMLLEAGQVAIDSAGEGRFRFVAEAASPSGWVVVRWEDAGGVWRELATYRLAGEGGGGSLEWLEGQGRACVTEFRPAFAPRHIESGNLRVTIAQGKPASATASTEVRIEEGERWGTGAMLFYSVDTKSYSLTGSADQRVRLGGAEFQATSDTVEGHADGTVIARGRVTGSVERGSPWGAASGPMRFAGESATSLGARGGTIVLEGDARLWQQERLVRAERLEYDRKREVIKGSGEVITVATFDTADGAASEAKVRARALTYDRLAGEAIYEGDVELTDPRAVLRCQRLVAALGADGDVERATLSGGVVILDAVTGREVEGQRAEFDPGTDTLDIWGTPVLVREPSGNQLKASHLRWLRATGTFLVVGEEDNPSEALYHAQAAGGPPGRKP